MTKLHLRRRAILAAAPALVAAPYVARAQTGKPEKSKVVLAVGGKSAIYYLSLTIAEKKGFFKDAGLVRDVQEVPVHRERFLGAGLHGDLVRGAIIDHLLPAGEFVPIPRIPPGRNDLQVGRKRGRSQFEPHLVVAFASGAVRYCVGAFLARNVDLPFSYDRPGK